MKRAN
jgi:hypothetical protein